VDFIFPILIYSDGETILNLKHTNQIRGVRGAS
jgi:hypothetical protein